MRTSLGMTKISAKCQKQTSRFVRLQRKTMQVVLPMGMKPVIDGVHVVPMGMANAFLIEGQDGLTLIDAGFPG